MQITSMDWGATADGRPVTLYRLTGEAGLCAEVLNYGGILRALYVPMADGTVRDVVLGCDSVADYEAQDKYLGALVGRVANRIGGAQFKLGGKTYSLAANNGPNCLHGGVHGFHEKIWDAKVTDHGLELHLHSPAGEEGFPGAVDVTVTYQIDSGNGLILLYEARSTAATPINLTNHSYFNLLGHDAGDVLTHRITVFANEITENDETSLPTGKRLRVDGTPFDLRRPTLIGEGIDADHEQIRFGRGYDHNFILKDDHSDVLCTAADLYVPGLRMTCQTTQPGMQLYTGNWLEGDRGKGGVAYGRRAAVCLETQNWPDAINKPSFPNAVLRPGQLYRHKTVYRFTNIE